MLPLPNKKPDDRTYVPRLMQVAAGELKREQCDRARSFPSTRSRQVGIAILSVFSGLVLFHSTLHRSYIEGLKWATQNQCHAVLPGPFHDVEKPVLLVLQGRPQISSVKMYSSSVFKDVRMLNTTFFPKPISDAEWVCALIRTYRNVLTEFFDRNDAPYVVVAEDDVDVASGRLDDLEAHIMSVLSAGTDGFYSFAHLGSGPCTYKFGTQLFMVRREFMRELHRACFEQCEIPIDICIATKFSFKKPREQLIKLVTKKSTNPARGR